MRIRLHFCKLTSFEKELVKEGFPVVYGIRPASTGKTRSVGSNLLEERTITGGASASEIKSIFVPKGKTSIVKKLIQEALGNDTQIQMNDIELIRSANTEQLDRLPSD